MRRRSGAVHCSTYQELLNSVSHTSPPPPADPNSPLIPSDDIDHHLQQQQSVFSPHHPLLEYYFSPLEEFRAKEADQIACSCPMVCAEMVLVCRDISAVSALLVDQDQVLRMMDSLLQKCCKTPRDIQVQTASHIVNIQIETDQLCRKESRPQADPRSRHQERWIASDAPRDPHSASHRPKQLDFVVYNNRVDLFSTAKPRLGQHRPVLYQSKFWLLPLREAYSPLHQVYLSKVRRLFLATLSDTLSLCQLSKAGLERAGLPICLDQVSLATVLFDSWRDSSEVVFK